MRLGFKKYAFILNLFLVIGLRVESNASVRVIRSDFLNQAQSGSDGPQLVEIENGKRRLYMLNYIFSDGFQKSIMLSKMEYKTFIKELNSFLERNNNPLTDETNIRSQLNPECEREIIHTQLTQQKPFAHKKICLTTLTSEEKIYLSQWIIELQKRLGSRIASRLNQESL